MGGVPDVTQSSGLFWATVFGAALGDVAGTIIQYLLTLAVDRRSQGRQRKALIKEMIDNKSLTKNCLEKHTNSAILSMAGYLTSILDILLLIKGFSLTQTRLLQAEYFMIFYLLTI